jgi:hypothetical protein
MAFLSWDCSKAGAVSNPASRSFSGIIARRSYLGIHSSMRWRARGRLAAGSLAARSCQIGYVQFGVGLVVAKTSGGVAN